jgi:hypothetical protein
MGHVRNTFLMLLVLLVWVYLYVLLGWGAGGGLPAVVSVVPADDGL